MLASIAVETFSNAALEAMAMARRVVLSDVGRAGNGFPKARSAVYPKGDVDRLTQILKLIHDRPNLRPWVMSARGGRRAILVLAYGR